MDGGATSAEAEGEAEGEAITDRAMVMVIESTRNTLSGDHKHAEGWKSKVHKESHSLLDMSIATKFAQLRSCIRPTFRAS